MEVYKYKFEVQEDRDKFKIIDEYFIPSKNIVFNLGPGGDRVNPFRADKARCNMTPEELGPPPGKPIPEKVPPRNVQGQRTRRISAYPRRYEVSKPRETPVASEQKIRAKVNPQYTKVELPDDFLSKIVTLLDTREALDQQTLVLHDSGKI